MKKEEEEEESLAMRSQNTNTSNRYNHLKIVNLQICLSMLQFNPK